MEVLEQGFRDFNAEVKMAIDGTIEAVLGPQVLDTLYDALKQHYSIESDEAPYRLDTLFSVLENTFGFQGSRTISRAIARRVYVKMGLKFRELPNYRLQDYLDLAKKELDNQELHLQRM
jgi:hypothetical protein